jgi:taurine dioxygenase
MRQRCARAEVSKTREDMVRNAGGPASVADRSAEHAGVRTHPETGRKGLFVNIAHTSHFKGMTEAESAPILNFLFQYQVRPEFTCRFRWEPGSIACWNNRAPSTTRSTTTTATAA